MKWTPETIKNLRDKLNLTQEEFGQKVGTTLGTINRWENGKTIPLGVFKEKLELLKKAHDKKELS